MRRMLMVAITSLFLSPCVAVETIADIEAGVIKGPAKPVAPTQYLAAEAQQYLAIKQKYPQMSEGWERYWRHRLHIAQEVDAGRISEAAVPLLLSGLQEWALDVERLDQLQEVRTSLEAQQQQAAARALEERMAALQQQQEEARREQHRMNLLELGTRLLSGPSFPPPRSINCQTYYGQSFATTNCQ